MLKIWILMLCVKFAYGFHKYAGAKPPMFQKHNYKYTIYSLDNTLELSSNIIEKDY